MNFLQILSDIEKTDVSFAKIGSNSKNLIICFGGNHHDGFERKQSLINFKNKRNDFDILYLRNRARWYLNDLVGIGDCIDDTILFIENELKNYDKTICMGISSGGFASILFASLCKVNISLSEIPQTDLNYCITNLPYIENKLPRNKSLESYGNLVDVLSKNTTYFTSYRTKYIMKDMEFDDEILHGIHHYEKIKAHDSVNLLDTDEIGRLSTDDVLKFLDDTI